MASANEPKPTMILLSTAVVYAGALIVFFKGSNGDQALAFSKDGIENVGRTMAPLVAIAAFIERAVEIAIASSRGPGALELRQQLDAANAGGDPEEKERARRRLGRYKLYTQRYSFAISLGLSLFASMVGVRAVSPLLASPQTTPRYFNMFDVILTSLLLAGGCDGIHQIVSTITTFLDTSRSTNKQKAPPSA